MLKLFDFVTRISGLPKEMQIGIPGLQENFGKKGQKRLKNIPLNGPQQSSSILSSWPQLSLNFVNPDGYIQHAAHHISSNNSWGDSFFFGPKGGDYLKEGNYLREAIILKLILFNGSRALNGLLYYITKIKYNRIK